MNLKSVMAHQFAQVPTVDCPRSKFDRSCGYKTTFDSGYLVPFYCDEVLPGDTFDVNATLFARLTTPIVPIMDNVFLDTFFFFVPDRLVWNNFQKFMGEQEDPGDSTEYLVPTITSPSGGFSVGSLFDYFGIPTGVAGISINALPFRAYNLIYNEWFRDENLQNSVKVDKTDGPDTYTDYAVLKRGKRHDYFTSCLPWPMKPVGGTGSSGVMLPLGNTAPVKLNPDNQYVSGVATQGAPNGKWLLNNGYPFAGGSNYGIGGENASGRSHMYYTSGSVTTYSTIYDPNGTLVADLSNATAASINALRQAFQLQKFYERDARGGSRYIEKILSHFGVQSPDARLQRPEYLGGGSGRIIIQQVEQNSSTDSTSPLGTLGAYGVFANNRNGFTKSFVEHGYIIGMLNVRCDLTYQQGIDRMFSRSTVVDFYWPSFAHLGEQAVLNKEIYAQGSSVVDSEGNIIDDKVFGYQERNAEYRYKPSKITGKMRSGVPGSLDVWHLSQYFTSLPTLSSTFIEEAPPLDRVLAVQNEPEFLLDAYIQNICIRPMPVYSIPGLVDHF